MSYIDNCTDGQVVKAYTRLMMVSDPGLGILMAQVPIPEANDLDAIAAAIRAWCFEGVKPLEASIYPATVEENVENELTITDVMDTDTVEGLVAAFHKAIKWNTPAK
jgi:hypothetical protein